MKSMIRLLTCAVLATMSTEIGRAALDTQSNGSDGDLVVTSNLVIDLGLATPGNWDTNNAANAGHGVYDHKMWAVVFHWRSVIVQGGATVTFINHPSHAPVVWLVQTNVTINGTVSLNGGNSLPAPGLAKGGPGGFNGGSGSFGLGAGASAGFGPGGATYDGWRPSGYGYYGGGGSYGSIGVGGSTTYGNASILPLRGGSGGGGGGGQGQVGGAGGGGAILIACAGTISVNSGGVISADGGIGPAGTGGLPNGNTIGGGSGGAIRLVSEAITGNGTIRAMGNSLGGLGRIRIERCTNSFTGTFAPTGPSVVELGDGTRPLIWVPEDGPAIKILSIGGNLAPLDPRAEFGAFGADTVLPRLTNTTVVVVTTNAEAASTILVRVTPRSNGNYSEVSTTNSVVLSQDPLVLRWTVNVPVQDGYAAIVARLLRP